MTDSLWTNGRISKDEITLLQSLIQLAAVNAARDGSPYAYESEKISFRSWLEGTTLHAAYSWKYPPKEQWFQTTKDKKECVNCLPEGSQGNAAREVWCEHHDYNFPKCPYGVATAKGETRPVEEVICLDRQAG